MLYRFGVQLCRGGSCSFSNERFPASWEARGRRHYTTRDTEKEADWMGGGEGKTGYETRKGEGRVGKSRLRQPTSNSVHHALISMHTVRQLSHQHTSHISTWPCDRALTLGQSGRRGRGCQTKKKREKSFRNKRMQKQKKRKKREIEAK